MNRQKRIPWVLCVSIAVSLMVGVGGCKTSENIQGDPTGVLMEYFGCKQSQSQGSDNHVSVFSTGTYDDCINYLYDGEGTLTLRHINAKFNCCPVEITAEIEFSGNLITITEREEDQLCDCICLFDLDYEIINLGPGRYTIRVIEPYVRGEEEVLEFTVDLFSAASGSYCLERN